MRKIVMAIVVLITMAFLSACQGRTTMASTTITTTITTIPDVELLLGVYLVPGGEAVSAYLTDFDSEAALKLYYPPESLEEDASWTLSGSIAFMDREEELSPLANGSVLRLATDLYLDFDVVGAFAVYGVYADIDGVVSTKKLYTLELPTTHETTYIDLFDSDYVGGSDLVFALKIRLIDYQDASTNHIVFCLSDHSPAGGAFLAGHGDWNIDLYAGTAFAIFEETYPDATVQRTLIELNPDVETVISVRKLGPDGFVIPEYAHLIWVEA